MNFDLNAMQFELDSLASSRCLSGPANLAAKRASELLRAVRSALDLPWETQAADLHGIGQNVEPNEYLKKVHKIGVSE